MPKKSLKCATSFLYDTAARCQEMLDIRIKDICFNEKTPYLYLIGKGSKTRSVPMMDATYRHLLKYLEKFHPDYKKNTDEFLFYITTHGIRHQMSQDTVEVQSLSARICRIKYTRTSSGIHARSICIGAECHWAYWANFWGTAQRKLHAFMHMPTPKWNGKQSIRQLQI